MNSRWTNIVEKFFNSIKYLFNVSRSNYKCFDSYKNVTYVWLHQNRIPRSKSTNEDKRLVDCESNRYK